MGAGKTVVSNELAIRTKRRCVSTDELIEKKEGRLISEIFRDSGEEYFRRMEQEVIRDLASQEDLIIDCGGGVVLQQENINNLKKNGVLFYLAASPGVIYERIKNAAHRPLLNVQDPRFAIQEMLEKRVSLYQQADCTLDTDGKSAAETADEILRFLQRLEKS